MHTSHLPKVPVLMNELPCVEPFMLSLPASRRSLRTRVRELRVRVSIVLLTLSLSYSVHVSVCTSSRGGLNGFPTWSIVSRSLPFHPLTLPRPPIHPIPTRFPLVVGCLWRRDVSSLPLYITPKNEERERERGVGGRGTREIRGGTRPRPYSLFLLPSLILSPLLLPLPFLGFLVWPSSCTTTPPAARSNPKIDLRRSPTATRHLFFKTISRISLRFLFFGGRRRGGESRGTRLNWANVAVDSDLFFSLVQDVLFGFTRLFG